MGIIFVLSLQLFIPLQMIADVARPDAAIVFFAQVVAQIDDGGFNCFAHQFGRSLAPPRKTHEYADVVRVGISQAVTPFLHPTA